MIGVDMEDGRNILMRIGKKLLRLIVVILAVTTLTFLIIDILPGDAAYDIAGQNATLEDVGAIRKELGLNRSLVVRYTDWLSNVLRGDFGKSYRTEEEVLSAIVSRLPVTIELMILSQVFALLLAIPAGIVCAHKADTGVDKSLSAWAFAMMSVPVFVMSIVLIYVFALKLRWLPATGYAPMSDGLWANLRFFILPATSIALVEWVPLMRVLRSDMISTLREDFILMARAKGLPVFHVLFGHALRPSSLTLITILGIQVGHLIGGALIVEIIFALPGVGRLFIGAIFGRDSNMIQGCILVTTIGYLGVNFVVDILYSILDPRIRAEKAVG